MTSKSDLRAKLSVFARQNHLELETQDSIIDVMIVIDEPRCFSFQISIRGGMLDPDRIQVSMQKDEQVTCAAGPDARTIWTRMLEAVGTAQEVVAVRDGVLEWEPSPRLGPGKPQGPT